MVHKILVSAPTQSNSDPITISSKGTGADIKKPYGPPTTYHPITFRRSGWDYMGQIEAPRTPECHEGVLLVPTQGGQHREEYRVVQHVQVEHYQGHF